MLLYPLGPTQSLTRGASYHSEQLDPPGNRINTGGIRFCSAPEDKADGVRSLCGPQTPGCYRSPFEE